jgi:hypothetical protein
MKISSKAQFYYLWEQGVLGNRTNIYRNPVEAFKAKFPYYGFRQLASAGGGKWERVERKDFWITYSEWVKLDVPFIMDSATYPAVFKDITLQGEVCRTFRGWEGFMGYTPGLPMRKAFPFMRAVSGSEVLVLFDRWMDPSSQDDLRDLLDLYPDATVEFTCFTKDVGNIPCRNTILWETRNYIWLFCTLLSTVFLS